MTFEAALHWTEVLVALAVCQLSAEHLRRDTAIFAMQFALAVLLLGGIAERWALLALWAAGLWQLHRFDGPYNGGADKMVLLVITCLLTARWLPTFAPVAIGYLAVQLTLSYFVSGWVKLKNAEWRTGDALSHVFAYSAYPSSEALRSLSTRRRLMRGASWGVIWFEVLFPLTLLHPLALSAGLSAGLIFHLTNAYLFGLNRFVWAWLSAFPALLWWQTTLPI